MICKQRLFLYISRTICEELKGRECCEFTEWVNTQKDALCTHCLRILNLRLCLDEMRDVAYWEYMNSTSERRQFLCEKFIALYFYLFQEFIEMGGEY